MERRRGGGARQLFVPGTMDAYSGTPLPKKLGIQAGSVVALLGAPVGFERKLGTVRRDIRIKTQARGSADMIPLFARSLADLVRRLPTATRAMAEGGSLWIAWPKKASGVATDLTQREVQALGLGAGLIDYRIAAIDKTWSALRFARRSTRSKRRR